MRQTDGESERDRERDWFSFCVCNGSTNEKGIFVDALQTVIWFFCQAWLLQVLIVFGKSLIAFPSFGAGAPFLSFTRERVSSWKVCKVG